MGEPGPFPIILIRIEISKNLLLSGAPIPLKRSIDGSGPASRRGSGEGSLADFGDRAELLCLSKRAPWESKPVLPSTPPCRSNDPRPMGHSERNLTVALA
jgi:hypothetical protein